MKKILVMILALVAIFCAFSGCSESVEDDSKNNTDITTNVDDDAEEDNGEGDAGNGENTDDKDNGNGQSGNKVVQGITNGGNYDGGNYN